MTTSHPFCDDSSVSVVVQGPLLPGVTPGLCAALRDHLPKSEVIISTWRGEDASGLDADSIVLNDDPGPYEPLATSRNVNRQIVSTRNGLAQATRPLAIKLRSDCVLQSDACLRWLLREQQVPRPRFNRVFRCRIIIPRHFSRDPVRHPFLHHPSDIFMLGLTEDLRSFWNAPLAEQAGLVAEQYLWLNCLQRMSNGRTTAVDVRRTEPTLSNMTDSESWLISNFFVVDTDKLGLTLPDKTANHPLPWCRVDTCYSTADWEKLSRSYSRSRRPASRLLAMITSRIVHTWVRPVLYAASRWRIVAGRLARHLGLRREENNA